MNGRKDLVGILYKSVVGDYLPLVITSYGGGGVTPAIHISLVKNNAPVTETWYLRMAF